MTSFKHFIEKYTELPSEDWEQIANVFKRVEYAKNETILEVGHVCRSFYFFESGIIRFYNMIDGEDITRTFTIPPYCFTSKTSFRKQVASQEGIQALDETVLWSISYEQYYQLEQLKSWGIFIKRLIHEVEEFFGRIIFGKQNHVSTG